MEAFDESHPNIFYTDHRDSVFRVIAYVIFLPISVFSFFVTWDVLVVGRLYSTTDPIWLLNAIPPFVFPEYGDKYLWPSSLVHLIWAVGLAGALVFPMIIIRLIDKERR